MKRLLAVLLLALPACASTPAQVQPLPEPAARTGLELALQCTVSLVVEGDRGNDSFGSGVILDRSGRIATVHHVVQDASRVTVLLAGGYTVRAHVLASDPVSDFALLQAEAFIPDRMAPAVLALQAPRPGQAVYSVGNPFGLSRYGGEPSVAHGVVSAVGRCYFNDETGRLYLNALQHDAPTNPGNSGGGVYDAEGRLLGLNALITTTRDLPGDSGVAFAIPAARVRELAERLLAGETIRHGWLGALSYKQATEIFPQGHGRLRTVFGLLSPGGPAELAGIQPGDVLLRLDSEDIYGMHELLEREDKLEAGRMLAVKVNRAGRELDLNLRASLRPWPGQ